VAAPGRTAVVPLVEPPKEHSCVPGRLIVIAAGQYDVHTPQLADLLAERHKIIGNNWQNASTAQLIARYLRRAVAVMERIDFSPTGLRKDLAAARSAPAYLYAAAELINHAADLSAASSVLTHENERRWRIFHQRIEQITPPG
jgi:hypothetical protein